MSNPPSLLLRGNFYRPSGFTYINRRLQQGLTERGFDVVTVPLDGAAQQTLPRVSSDVYFFHGDPYDFLRAPAQLNVCFLHWEYRRLPPAWVAQLNRVCDVVIAPSHASRDLYRDSGITVPMLVFPSAVDHAEFHPNVPAWVAPTEKKFRFVHLGGAHPRRGTDILLQAYAAEFSASDDVALILKPFHYQHHRAWLEQQRVAFQHADAPHLVFCDETFDSVAGVFTAADVGVYPLRAECFGLPVLECIASGRRVIVTEYTALDEFCGSDNAEFVRAREIENGDHTALEPDVLHLRALMRAAYLRGKPDAEEQRRVAASVAAFTWEHSIGILADGLREQLEQKKRARTTFAAPPTRSAHSSVSKTFPDDFRFLVVAPAFLEWDLGSYVKNILGAQNLEVATFAYREHGDRYAVNAQLLEYAAQVRPDVMIGLKLGRIEPETIRLLRAQGIVVALWYVDCFDATVPPQMARLIPSVDVFFTSAYGMIPTYQALSATPVHWLYEGAYLPAFPEVEIPLAQRALYSSQVAFVGNVFHPPVPDEALALQRFRLLARIAENYSLKIWGLQGDPTTRARWGKRAPLIEWLAYHEELVKICRAAEIVLGINTINTVELYFSNRVFLTLACGGFLLTHYVPRLEALFTNHEHLVWFHSDEECLELCGYYLAHPTERERIAQRGQAWVRSQYAMDAQIARMLSVIQNHCVSETDLHPLSLCFSGC